ncbi:hypothetical protein HYW75_04260 [Candidatus Pacearchaeota archaeon]|nr:hypothetical protein [Candidatus Pacearchaeota archaeon]
MKKRLISNLAVIIFITIFLFSYLSKAQLEDQLGELQGNVEKVQDVSDNLSTSDQRTEYLKQEWTKILERTQVGRFLLGISSILKALSPAFKFLIGIEFSLSWLFFLSLGVWIAIVVIIYKAVKEPFQMKGWISLAIAIIIPTISAQFGMIVKTVSFFVPLFKNKWIILGSILITIILLYIYSLFMKTIGKKIKEKTKRENEERREQKAETLEKLEDIELRSRGIK